MKNETQGKCTTCKVRWLWQGRPRLKDALCPQCGKKLDRTTHFLKWPVRDGVATAVK